MKIKYEEIEIKAKILVPIGATHYYGNIKCPDLFFKKKVIGGIDHWFQCKINSHEWVFSSHQLPHFAKSIEEKIIK